MNKFTQFIKQKSERYTPEIVEVQTKMYDMMTKPKMQAVTQGLALVATLAVIPFSSAAGFEDQAKGMADKVYKGIYAFVGVVAAIVVLWQCVEGWSGRKSWMDVLSTCIWVVVAAASGAFVTWLWQQGQSMQFG